MSQNDQQYIINLNNNNIYTLKNNKFVNKSVVHLDKLYDLGYYPVSIVLCPEPYSIQRQSILIGYILFHLNNQCKINSYCPLVYLANRSTTQYYCWIYNKQVYHNFYNNKISKTSLATIKFPAQYTSNNKDYGLYLDCNTENLYYYSTPQAIKQQYWDQYC